MNEVRLRRWPRRTQQVAESMGRLAAQSGIGGGTYLRVAQALEDAILIRSSYLRNKTFGHIPERYADVNLDFLARRPHEPLKSWL